MLGGIADIRRGRSNAVVSQYDISSMVQIYATTQGRDLGAVSSDIRDIITKNDKDKPKGAIIALVGQTETMHSAYFGLMFGLLGAIVLVYFVIVINFQSWADPFIVITALPAALAGIVWMLFGTHTTLSVPALTGAIMCMGVATANSVLVISFAREKLTEFGDATQAALEAGFVRLRSGDDDRAGHGDRHAADGARPRRRWRTERAARPRRDRRPDFCHHLDAVLRPGGVQYCSSAPWREAVAGIWSRRSSCPLIELPLAPCRAGCAWSGSSAPSSAIVIVGYGVVSARAQNSRLHDLTEAQAVPTVAIVTPSKVENNSGFDLPGRLQGLHQRAHLCACPRLSQELEARYRQ